MKKKIAVMSVAYPQALQFIDEHIESLTNQTSKNFTLFLFGDGISEEELTPKLSNCNLELVFIPIKENLSISKVREFAIKYIKKQGYDICIFTDSDEFVDKNFVKLLSEKLRENYKVAFSNASLYFHETKEITYNYLSDLVPDEVDMNFIIDKNCLGLGHTGLTLDIFDDRISFPEEIIAVDWWLFTRILYSDLKAGFVPKTFSYYRLYEHNIGGFLNLDEKRIIRGVNVKMLHYKNLCDLGQPFIKLYRDFRYLHEKLKVDESFKKRYIYEILNRYKNKKYLWWEPILNTNQLTDEKKSGGKYSRIK